MHHQVVLFIKIDNKWNIYAIWLRSLRQDLG